MELREVLRWVVSGGGAGVLAYYIIARIKWPAEYPSERKRWITLAVTFGLADISFVLMTLVGYEAIPLTALEWVEHLWLVGTTAFGLAQMIHATIDLRATDKRNAEDADWARLTR